MKNSNTFDVNFIVRMGSANKSCQLLGVDINR